ncbi:hypothetical protein [Nocardia aurantia]|uniref:F5/8 type C domain-containing protein n=1 Tax=Nocardia aurantia TaxID=2585199 RepID=A0A7K0DR74_9NOCA|nr:hypothetical protein [Nocardia aurantia]MQY28249.1 hypothetical protein [Nocardia aurantia]
MPADASGDVFIRHRDVVLDALLSDPALGPTAASDPVSGPSSRPVSGAVVAPGSMPAAVPPPGGSGAISGPLFAAPVAGEPVIDPDAANALLPPRTPDGPKASERILALLNGTTPDNGSSAMNLGTEFSQHYGATSTPEAEPADPPKPDPAETNRSAAAAPGPGQTIITQLRRPKVALILVAVVAVAFIIALVTTSGGGSQPSGPVYVATSGAAQAPSSAAPAPTSVASSALTAKSATAHCPPGSTPGMDAFAGQGKAWSCVRAFKVDGQVLIIDLGRTYQIDSIGIVPGWDSVGTDGVDQWTKYRTASRVSYKFNDASNTVYTQQTLDQRGLVVTKMSSPLTASKVVLTVLESKGDPTANTVAISSIVITGH